MYEYACSALHVIDGDTVDLLIDLGFGICALQRVRLYGLNAPEIHDRNEAQRALADKAKLALQLELSKQGKLTVKTFKDKKEKFGRLLAVIYRDDVSINDIMLSMPGVVAYFGGKKEPALQADL